MVIARQRYGHLSQLTKEDKQDILDTLGDLEQELRADFTRQLVDIRQETVRQAEETLVSRLDERVIEQLEGIRQEYQSLANLKNVLEEVSNKALAVTCSEASSLVKNLVHESRLEAQRSFQEIASKADKSFGERLDKSLQEAEGSTVQRIGERAQHLSKILEEEGGKSSKRLEEKAQHMLDSFQKSLLVTARKVMEEQLNVQLNSLCESLRAANQKELDRVSSSLMEFYKSGLAEIQEIVKSMPRPEVVIENKPSFLVEPTPVEIKNLFTPPPPRLTRKSISYDNFGRPETVEEKEVE